MSNSKANASERQLLEELHDGGCPICERRQASEQKYRDWFFIERYHQPELLTALTESLSFCPDHTHYLSEAQSGKNAFTSVYEVLARRSVSRFAAGETDQLRWETLAPCPACRSRSETVNRNVSFLHRGFERESVEQYGQSGVLCFPHVRLLTEQASPEMMSPLLTTQETAIRSALDDLHDLHNEYERPADGAHLPATIRTALHVGVGHEPVAFSLPPPETPHPSDRDPVRDFIEAIERRNGCPICLEVAHAWREWVTWLDQNTDQGNDLSDVLPTCPKHVWGCVRYGDHDLAQAAATAALQPALDRIMQAENHITETDGSDPSDRHESHQQSTDSETTDSLAGTTVIEYLRSLVSISVISSNDRLTDRLRSLHRNQTAMARQALDRPIRCPVCKHLDTARERALDLLFALLEQRQYRISFENGYGLCFKHFARSLSRDPSPEIREILLDVESAKLTRLHWELREAQRKHSWDARPEQKGTEQSAGRRAAARFSGSYGPVRPVVEESP